MKKQIRLTIDMAATAASPPYMPAYPFKIMVEMLFSPWRIMLGKPVLIIFMISFKCHEHWRNDKCVWVFPAKNM